MPPLTSAEEHEFLVEPGAHRQARHAARRVAVRHAHLVRVGRRDVLGDRQAAGSVRQNVRADERAFLVVDKEDAPYVRVNVEARARVVAEEWTDAWVEMTRRMTLRYLGDLQYLEARLKFPLSVIQLTPVRMNSWRVTSFPPDRTFTTEARWNPA